MGLPVAPQLKPSDLQRVVLLAALVSHELGRVRRGRGYDGPARLDAVGALAFFVLDDELARRGDDRVLKHAFPVVPVQQRGRLLELALELQVLCEVARKVYLLLNVRQVSFAAYLVQLGLGLAVVGLVEWLEQILVALVLDFVVF